MLFSSIPFLFYFLPCVFVLYFLVPMRWKNTMLLLASLFFYAWGEPKFVVFMLAYIVQGYVLARLVEKYRADRRRAKLFLTLSLVFSLGLLGYCKYADFFLSGFNALTGLHIPLLRVALPIGISFYTFQILSYVVDVYRGDVKAQRNFIDLAAYVAMFPQLIAGPIVRYSDIASQLEHRTHSLADVAAGARRFVLGLGKKVLLANVFFELITTFKASGDRSVLFYWLYAAACVLNIYFDFSGYSDMAIGLGRIFGFRYLENFDYPYISASITEFWRRWHMSLGSWFRDYVYIPLGGNRVSKDYNIEMQKVMSAVNMGAEAIMDLSSHGNTQPFRQKLTHECPVMIGTVPVYDSVIHYQRDLATLTAQDFIDVVRLHAEDGVDFVTLHCGITRKTIDQIRKHKRKMNIVSRGGSLVFAWMCMTGNENPFYEHFDEILDICEEHDVTISLGDACRPGCLADATDVCQIEELVRLGELTKRAWAHNVQVMVEGPGHVPLNQVAANMEVQKSICMGAPFYVLGPLVTDIAPGYDHITAAIGGAVAAASGAAFLCYVTPAEHLALPNVDDVKQGIVASKIAAHAADIAKGIPHARDIDDKMGDARRVLDWDAQFACAIDPETAKAIRDARLPEDDHSDTCSMCGKFCAVRSMNKALAGEYIDIL